MRRTRRAVAVSVLLAACLAFVAQYSSRVSASVPASTAIAQARAWIAKAIEPASSRLAALRKLKTPIRLAQAAGGGGTGPTIHTDKSDYSPGETVVVTGSGWNSGAPVSLTFHEMLDQPFHADVTLWTHADGNGNINTAADTADADDYVLENHDAGVTYQLTASGQTASLTTASITAIFTDSGPNSADLDQCRNGSLAIPDATPCQGDETGDLGWVNGNTGQSNSHYIEGESNPYRARIENLSDFGPNSAEHAITIEWDTLQGGKHALDYITTYNRSYNVDPCTGSADPTGCSSHVTTAGIPEDPNVSGAGLHPGLDGTTGTADDLNTAGVCSNQPCYGVFTLFGGDITGVSGYTTDNSHPDELPTSITVTFRALIENPVLAWAGHISTRKDWGPDNSAGAVQGSGYHTRLLEFDPPNENVGNQDRSLSADAVILPGSITIVKDATPNGSTSFSFTGSPSPLTNFSLVDDGTSANTKVFSNITDFQTYTVNETPIPANWSFDSLTCSKTSPNGGSYAVTNTSVDIKIKEGENWTCTYTNHFVKGDPTVSTQIHNSSGDTPIVNDTVALGSTVHDQATVTGTVSLGTPTGNVDFYFYSTIDCQGTAQSAGQIGLVNGVAHPSSSKGPLAAGSYSFQAHYNGDDNYSKADSPCEPLTVSKGGVGGQYLITTEIHNASEAVVTSVPLGTTVHDKAILSGGTTATIVPTGDVTFTFYTTTTDCTGASTGAGTITLDGTAVAHPSTSEGPLAHGSYSFRAHYNGDPNYGGGDGPCEDLTVTKANTSTATVIHNGDPATDGAAGNAASVALGSTVHDKATVTSANSSFTIGGSVSFTFYNNGTCYGTGTAAGTVNVVSGAAHPSSSEGPLAAGSYSFKAVYGGDTNFNGSTGDCEVLTVNQKQLYISTTLHKADHSALANGGEALGAIHDTAQLSGLVSNFAPGSVTFYFFPSGTSCTNKNATGGTSVQTIAADATGFAHGTIARPDPFVAGKYNFMAVVAGNSNYLGATSDCEPFTVSTITIIKYATPAQGSFAFTTTGSGYNGFTLTGSTASNGNKNTQVVTAGSYTAKEGTQLGWILDGIGQDPADPNNPNACAVAGTGQSSGTGNVNTQTATITLNAGDAVTCVFENTGNGATRTQGFWATHSQLANLAWFGGIGYGHTFPGVQNVGGISDQTLCAGPKKDLSIAGAGSQALALGRLMGGFWSDISKTSGGTKRSNVDQSRMQLLQQLLAAELNASAFGSVPSGGSGMFAQWESAYCNTTASAGQAIQTALQQAASFNSQGDSSTFTPGTSADSKTARAIANIPYWNTLP